jgi:DNA topoisomerase-1
MAARTAATHAIPERVAAEPTIAAKVAKLHYVSDLGGRGYRRAKRGEGFAYLDDDGRAIADEAVLARIRKLAIPPAWTDVWIAADERAHLQATGRDARGRKQYRYHPDWRRVRDTGKFGRMVAFADALPAIRARVEADLRRPGLPREKVVATVVRLLETTLIRVGNMEYARQNKSYGLTTLRDRHVAIDGGTLHFEFKAKSGKMLSLDLADRRLARIVRACREIPGQHLFQYIDAEGERQSIGSADVNQYLREASGQDFTAKDFRTWAGTVLAASTLIETVEDEADYGRKAPLVETIKQVAARLGNTPTVCRNSYIHPGIIECWTSGTLIGPLRRAIEAAEESGSLSPAEAAVRDFLAALPPAGLDGIKALAAKTKSLARAGGRGRGPRASAGG